MTIATTVSKVTAEGNSATVQFSYAFLIPSSAVLQVIYTDASGNDTVLTSSEYSVTGLGQAAGGFVTYPLSGPAIASGTYLTIARVLPLKQLVTISNQGAFYPQAVEAGLDYLMMALQQVDETQERALVAPITDLNPPLPLPTATARANQLLGFDGDGNPIAAEPSSALVSSAMQPVVSAATLALARTAMGLGAMATEGIGAGLQDDGAGDARVNFLDTALAVSTAVGAAYHAQNLICTGPITLTLAKASTLWNGFGIWVFAYTGAVTIAIDSGDSFKGQASGASIGVPANSVAYISTNGVTAWYVNASKAVLPLGIDGNATALSNLRITNNSGSPNTRIDVSADSIGVSDPTGRSVLISAPSATINTANVGVVNGLDTGVLAANSWYYVFAIAGAALTGTISSGFLLSLSSTAPTMPSGYTFKKRLGSVRTNGSVNFYRTIQLGRKVQYIVGTNPATVRSMITGASGSPTTPTWTAVAVASFSPPTAATISVMLNGNATAGSQIACAAPNNSYGAASSANPPPLMTPTSANNIPYGSFLGEFVLESTNIFYASNGASMGLYCVGWSENL